MGAEYELELLSRLVELDTNSSTKKNYVECAELVKNEAEKAGLDVHVVSPKAPDGKPRPNVIVTLDAGAKETLIIATHFDVVPAGTGWVHDPFKLTIKGEKAYGRGTVDDKSNIAAAFGALKELKKSGKSKVNVRLLVTCDEEVGGEFGIGLLAGEKEGKGDAVLVLDSSPHLTVGASGVISGKIIVKGKQGHAGYPHNADNAITRALPLLIEMHKFSDFRALKHSKFCVAGYAETKVWGRFSITMLHSGEKANIIPGEAEAQFDLRMLPEEDPKIAEQELKEFFARAVKKTGVNAELEIIDVHNGYATDPSNPFVSAFEKIIKLPHSAGLGADDGAHFAVRGLPVVAYGTIRDECNFHGKDEFVYLEDIPRVRDAVIKLCEDWKNL